MNIYADLFLTFAKIGVCTFGGGYAMLPILQRELVEKRGWATEEELSDYFAIGQCTPGIIAVNTATFVGHSRKGAAGGVVATLGLVFPCLVIIMLIAAFLQNFAEQPVVVHAFNGVRACVCALILSSVLKLRKSTVVDRRRASSRWCWCWRCSAALCPSQPGGRGACSAFSVPPWCWWWPPAWPDCASGRREEGCGRDLPSALL